MPSLYFRFINYIQSFKITFIMVYFFKVAKYLSHPSHICSFHFFFSFISSAYRLNQFYMSILRYFSVFIGYRFKRITEIIFFKYMSNLQKLCTHRKKRNLNFKIKLYSFLCDVLKEKYCNKDYSLRIYFLFSIIHKNK